MLEHDAVPTMPFRKFELAFAGDALLLDLSANVFVSELRFQIGRVLDRFPSRQAVEQEAVVQVEAANMLVGNDDAVQFLAALLRFFHVLDRLHARGFRAGTHAELVADLQPVDFRQHLRHAGFRLENHLETVELEAAVVFGSDVGKLE